MARKITEEDKILINELYLKLKTYAAVSRELGFAPTTVKKYIIPNYISKDNIKKNIFKGEIPPLNKKIFQKKNFGDICVLSLEEKIEIEELWKEILV